MASNPLVGAWERVSDVSEGVLIYTGSHYAAVMPAKGRKRPAAEQVSPAEALESLLACQAQAGTYAINGSTITHTKVVNSRAETLERPSVFDYNIDGDTMTHTAVRSGPNFQPGDSLSYHRIPTLDSDSPLLGAWEMVDDVEQGVIIFTSTHYATVRSHKNRDLPKGDTYTPEEAINAITTCGAMSGTYTRSGEILTMERTANLRPQATGVNGVVSAIIQGETLRLQSVSGITVSDQLWRKVT